MSRNNFVDIAKITIEAGNGGDGKVSFRREKYIPKGGPDGGDGGNGGNIVLQATQNMATLMDFRSKSKYKATNGQQGGGRNMKGADGEDLILKVPVGTLVYEIRENESVLVGDLVEIGQELMVARGGLGGKGNTRFKSSTNRTPLNFTPGTKGQEKTLKLEIKLIADIGLVGLPNAGKSTLINQLAGTQAKVANYPFTTLNPNLGVAKLKDGRKIILADIPGLIEGASEGKGLGDDFLRHVERTRIIVHLIDPLGENVTEPNQIAENAIKSYKTIRNELKNYSQNLLEKKAIVVINKIDIVDIKDQFEEIKAQFKKESVDLIGISALSGEGTEELINLLTAELKKTPPSPSFEVKTPTKVYTINDLPNKRIVFRK